MALAVERHWPADKKLFGIALTRYGHGLPTGAHPRGSRPGTRCPTRPARRAAREMLGAARAIKPIDLLLALFSGGGSACCRCRSPGVSIADLQRGDARPAEERRGHPGDQHGAQAPVADPGRAPRRRLQGAGAWR